MANPTTAHNNKRGDGHRSEPALGGWQPKRYLTPRPAIPRGEVRLAWHAKETTRAIHAIDDPTDADQFLTELADDMSDPDHPPEVRALGRTLRRWHDPIVAWHRARVSNGPTEAINNLIKRIKRIGFGLRRFAHYRLRVLLYAGHPNWDLLPTIDPAEIR